MLDGIRLSLKVQRLERQKRRTFKRYAPLIKLARCKNDNDEAERLSFDERTDVDLIDDEIDQLHSNYLIRRAHRYFLAIPEFKPKGADWEESQITGGWRLTRPAFEVLRAKVRAEEKERRGPWQNAVLWVTATTGLIGALTGLISAIHGHGN